MNIDKELTVRQLLEWVVQQGFKQIAFIEPTLLEGRMLVDLKTVNAYMKTREVVREQLELTALFTMACKLLPASKRPRLFRVDDTYKKSEQIKFRKKTDLVICIHPTRPLFELNEVCQITVCFRQESTNDTTLNESRS